MGEIMALEYLKSALVHLEGCKQIVNPFMGLVRMEIEFAIKELEDVTPGKKED